MKRERKDGTGVSQSEDHPFPLFFLTTVRIVIIITIMAGHISLWRR